MKCCVYSFGFGKCWQNLLKSTQLTTSQRDLRLRIGFYVVFPGKNVDWNQSSSPFSASYHRRTECRLEQVCLEPNFLHRRTGRLGNGDHYTTKLVRTTSDEEIICCVGSLGNTWTRLNPYNVPKGLLVVTASRWSTRKKQKEARLEIRSILRSRLVPSASELVECPWKRQWGLISIYILPGHPTQQTVFSSEASLRRYCRKNNMYVTCCCRFWQIVPKFRKNSEKIHAVSETLSHHDHIWKKFRRYQCVSRHCVPSNDFFLFPKRTPLY